MIPFLQDSETNLPVNERWKNFLNYLEVHGEEYNQVLIADTRDLIFQGDVFASFADEGEYLGYTVEADTIGGNKSGDRTNHYWITNCFGKEEADKLADKEIICEGTIIGTIDSVKMYIKKMLEFMPSEQFHGVDQAVEQYIIYNNLLPIKNLIKIDCHSGAILTEQLFHQLNGIKVGEDKILRGDGKIPAIAHQYDRFSELVELVDKIYRDKNFEGNFKFTDAKSSFEQMLSLISAEKFDDALKFAVNLSDNPDFNEKNFVHCDFRGYFEYLLDFWATIVNKAQQQTTALEMLEVAIQKIFVAIFTNVLKSTPIYLLNYLADLTLKAVEQRRTVSENFKTFIVQNLCEVAEKNFQAQNFELCLRILDSAEKFNLSLNKNFYALKAHVCINLNMKNEAVQTIEKYL